MSIFGKLFGKSSAEKAPTTQEAIQKLLEVEDLMVKRQAVLERKIDDEIKTAKANGVKNKRIALQALKRKKRYEAQLTQIDGTLTTLEYQRESLENANTNKEVFKTLADASKSLKNVHKDLDSDKVHELMDDISEQQEISKEITDAISNPIGMDMNIDEDELLAELEELEQEDLDKELLDLPSTGPLPDVPNAVPEATAATTSKKPAASAEEKELDELLSWAS